MESCIYKIKRIEYRYIWLAIIIQDQSNNIPADACESRNGHAFLLQTIVRHSSAYSPYVVMLFCVILRRKIASYLNQKG